eukprot:1444383-Alexandrium_andersonii.AAC.1
MAVEGAVRGAAADPFSGARVPGPAPSGTCTCAEDAVTAGGLQGGGGGWPPGISTGAALEAAIAE